MAEVQKMRGRRPVNLHCRVPGHGRRCYMMYEMSYGRGFWGRAQEQREMKREIMEQRAC